MHACLKVKHLLFFGKSDHVIVLAGGNLDDLIALGGVVLLLCAHENGQRAGDIVVANECVVAAGVDLGIHASAVSRSRYTVGKGHDFIILGIKFGFDLHREREALVGYVDLQKGMRAARGTHAVAGNLLPVDLGSKVRGKDDAYVVCFVVM